MGGQPCSEDEGDGGDDAPDADADAKTTKTEHAAGTFKKLLDEMALAC